MEQVLVFIKQNPYVALGIGIAVAEVITRLTPTEKDDAFVQRLGAGIKKVLDAIKLPNVKK